jgi:hypothetical protein
MATVPAKLRGADALAVVGSVYVKLAGDDDERFLSVEVLRRLYCAGCLLSVNESVVPEIGCAAML